MKRMSLVAAATLVVLSPLPATAQDPEAAEATVRWTVAPEGNEARYRIREQLAGLDFPNDAIGATGAVRGTLVVDGQGRVVPGESRIVVETGTLTSDRDRRDGYVRGRILLTEEHPEVVFAPTEIRGLPGLTPAAGEHAFELVGDLTITGTTRPVTWQATALFSEDAIEGTAVTRFTFDTFGLERPRVRIVLSVDEDIALEYDFRLIRERAP